MGSTLIVGKGSIGSRLANLIGARAIGREVGDITTEEGRERVAEIALTMDSVVIGVRPPANWSSTPEEFYTKASLLAWKLKQQGVSVILLSSSAVYRSHKSEDFWLETDMNPLGAYGRGKLIEECMYKAVFGDQHLLTLRVHDTYGEAHGVVHALKIARDVGQIPVLRNDVVMDFTHLDDMVRLIAQSMWQWMKTTESRTMDVGTGMGMTPVDLWKMMGGVEYEISDAPSTRGSSVADIRALLEYVPKWEITQMMARLTRYLCDHVVVGE